LFFINIQGSRKVFLKLVPSAVAVAAQEQVVHVPDFPKAAVLHSPHAKNVGTLLPAGLSRRTTTFIFMNIVATST
jgi:hypothetical protein